MNAQVKPPVPLPLFKDASERTHMKIIAAGVAMHGMLCGSGTYGEANAVLDRSFELAELFIKRAEEMHDLATRLVEPSAEVSK